MRVDDNDTSPDREQQANRRDEPYSAGRRRLLQGSGLVLGAGLFAGTSSAQEQTPLIPPLDGTTPPDYNPASEHVFTILATIADPMTVGETARGQVRAIPITGGEVVGEAIQGRVVPGGADWQLTRSDGVTEIEATYAIQLEDGTTIKVVNRGLIAPGPEGTYFRTHVQFTAPEGKHAWLNEAIFLCKAGLHAERENTVQVDVFRVI